MTEFEQVLQECLQNVDEGTASVDECLARYPQHAGRLEPILLTSAYLARGREARVSEAFKRRVRTRLLSEMYAHPRRAARSGFLFTRLAISFAVLILAFLAAGTVYAQGALPGEPFYGWKLASENVWRAVSPDPLGTELVIAERRAEELLAVRDDPALYAQVLSAYLEIVESLTAQMNAENAARVMSVLNAQAEKLNEAGILLQPPQPDQELVPPILEPDPTPTAAPLPTLQTSPVNPTELPQTAPTVVPPEIIPTIQELPEVIPTIGLPPLVP